MQHPVNLVDPHYLSFIENVLPKVRAKGLGLLAMKCNAMGGIGKNKIASYAECLRFTLSQDVDTVVSGATTVEELEQNVATVKAFHKMTPKEQSELLTRTKSGPVGSKGGELQEGSGRRRAARASRRRPRVSDFATTQLPPCYHGLVFPAKIQGIIMPKLKTHKGASKRFKKTGTGLVVRNHAFGRHILTSKPHKRKKKLHQSVVADKADQPVLKRMIPY